MALHAALCRACGYIYVGRTTECRYVQRVIHAAANLVPEQELAVLYPPHVQLRARTGAKLSLHLPSKEINSSSPEQHSHCVRADTAA